MIANLLRVTLLIVLLAFAASATVDAQNLVLNGSFENGSFSGWSVSGDSSLIGVCDVSSCPGGFAPEAGNFAAYFGSVGDTATISQEIPTTPGQLYALKFYLADPEGGTPNYFSVTFGTTTLTLNDFGAAFGWQEFDFYSPANSNQTLLSFTFRHDPAYWFLDDVAVNGGGCCGTTPEPATLTLLASGVIAIAGRNYRRLRR